MVSETFDPAAWRAMEGFDLTDITYHRAVDHGTVRVAFDRPEVRNAFRPHTVDELYRVLDHARTSSDVGCVLPTGNGPSEGRRVGVLPRRRESTRRPHDGTGVVGGSPVSNGAGRLGFRPVRPTGRCSRVRVPCACSRSGHGERP